MLRNDERKVGRKRLAKDLELRRPDVWQAHQYWNGGPIYARGGWATQHMARGPKIKSVIFVRENLNGCSS